MTSLSDRLRENVPAVALLLAFVCSIALKLSIFGVGSPFITIDDKTAFEGGFLVWFGNTPPQRMYLESWVYGITCLVVYAFRCLTGLASTGLGANIVADAYRDFFSQPEPYVQAYRGLTLVLDLATTLFVYLAARRVLAGQWRVWRPSRSRRCSCSRTTFTGHRSSLAPTRCSPSLPHWACIFYVLSEGGTRRTFLFASAVALGLGAGVKLHGAFLVIFLCVDLLRIHGFRAGLCKAIPFAILGGFFFCVGAGSPLFDPLLYVKLRVRNVQDDHSPWITWGAHFVTFLRGAGWIALPAALLGCFYAFARKAQPVVREVGSFAVVAIGWALLFGITRPLRAYWMLPALPVFYVLAVYAAGRLPVKRLGEALVAVMLAVLLFQSIEQVRQLRSVPYDELRDWVVQNVQGDAFYVLGDDALILPKNERSLQVTGEVLRRSMQRDVQSGMPYTMRHAKNWEERSTLELLDMLGYRASGGYEFYDFNTTPPEGLAEVLELKDLRYILVQAGYTLEQQLPQLREVKYRLVGEKIGAGGNERGLKYRIYERE